jgi:hypothetical protein
MDSKVRRKVGQKYQRRKGKEKYDGEMQQTRK